MSFDLMAETAGTAPSAEFGIRQHDVLGDAMAKQGTDGRGGHRIRV
ncbi:hypothetical protein [Streptomyces rhizosphaerihabitans]|nr:hypothetical protein [Streptomyces rhizosphaerihabitans]MCT9009140.1 hypothetical protein [Streptomyces rhizosphaerihabitans]